MARRPFGLHYANDSGVSSDDLRATRDINPSIVTLMQPYFGAAQSIREQISGDVTIVGRFYGSPDVDAWHPPYEDAGRMRAYGVYCAQQAIQFNINVVQFANEPSIESPIPTTPEGFAIIRDGAAAWLDGFLTAWQGKVMAGTIPLAPGNREDDYGDWGYRGADILRDVWQRFHVLLLHNYWTCDPGSVQSEWWGYRWTRQIEAYQWRKPWAITEFNRDPACSGRPVAEEVRLWFSGIKNAYFMGADWFIWRSGDPSFAGLQMQPQQDLINLAIELNKEATVALADTKMTYIGPATLKASTVNQVEIEASGVDQGIFTLIVNPDNVDDAASVDGATSFFGVLGSHAPEATQQRIVNGRNILQVPINRLLVPGPVGADFKISIAETDGTSFESGDRINQRVQIVSGAATQPDPPVATADYDAAWAGLTAAQQAAAKDEKLIRAGEYGKDVIRWRKGEIPEPPDVVLATDPPKAQRR